MTTHPMRGREAQLARVHAVLERTIDGGQGGVVCIVGEAGIGKTALLHAAAEHAASLNFCVGFGKAEERDQIAPMAPLLLALRSGPVPILSRDAFSELAPLYTQQLWLVDRLTALIEERALLSPLLIVIDDVQWLDALSTFAIRLLLERLAGSAVVWFFASRTYPASGSPRLLKELIGTRHFERIELGPLPSDDVLRIAADRIGSVPSGRLAELLEAANGFPFLVVELMDGHARDERLTSVASPQDSEGFRNRRELPAPLLIGVRGRLESLMPATLQLVQVASVFGRSFRLEDAAAVLGIAPWTAIIPDLVAAVDAGVLNDRGSHISFRHDLFRQAVYEDISPQRLMALHRAAASQILAAYDDPVSAAPHALVFGAHGDRAAIDILKRAATSLSASMPSMAIELIERALSLIAMGEDDWLEVGLQAMRILAEGRHEPRAIAIADQLLGRHLTDEQGARVEAQASRILIDMGLLRDAQLRISRSINKPALTDHTRAALMASNALIGSISAESEVAQKIGENALLASREVGNIEAEADALRALAESARNDGRYLVALDRFRDLRALTPTPPTDEILTLQLLDDYNTSDEMLAQAALHVVERRTIPNALAMAFARLWKAFHTGVLDELEVEALTIIKMCEDIREHRAAHEARISLARVAQLRGNLSLAREHLASAAPDANADLESWDLRELFMEALIADTEGDVMTALQFARKFVQPQHGYRHRWRWSAWWLTSATRIAVRGGDIQLAEYTANMARILAEQNPNVATIQGAAEHTSGLARGDLSMLRRAQRTLQRSPRPLLQADAAAELGVWELKEGNKDAALSSFEDARSTYDTFGAHGEVRRMQRLMQEAGVRRHWTRPAVRPIAGWDALTEAEKRVARLVAEGRSNRSAATALMLSPNTVATHLRSIFGKLSVESRSQLTRFVLSNSNDQLIT